MIIDSFLYDAGVDYGSAENMVDEIIGLTKTSWGSGADVVLFPEYMWCVLLKYDEYSSLENLALKFWSRHWSKLKHELSHPDKAVILGSVPFSTGGELRNRAPMLVSGKDIFQDKLCFTPWDDHLDAGDEIVLFTFKGFRCATLICLDIEMPETAALLKRHGPIDLVFVPSDTETLTGAERVCRCASARSVELGAAIIVSPLVGTHPHDFINENIGQAALYMPSLAATSHCLRIDERGIHDNGTRAERFQIDLSLLKTGRDDLKTTNPARVRIHKEIKIQS